MDVRTSDQPDRLIIRHDLRVVRSVDLNVDSMTFGRSASCDVTLDHEAVSRTHARLERQDVSWRVLDLRSANGVFVNGERVQESRLCAGDVIEIRPFAINYLGATDRHVLTDSSVLLSERSLTPTIVRDVKSADRDFKQRLEELYALSHLVIRRQDNGSFWQKVHASLARSLTADRCAVVGLDERAGVFRLAPRARTPDAILELSGTVLREVTTSGQGVLIQDVGEDSRFADALSLASRAVGSVICVPVIVEGQTRAVIYADRHASRPPFEAEDLDFVIAAVELAASAVGMDELHDRSRELSRVRGRIEAAREMQELLLPSPIPQPDWGQVAARNYPAEQMSGDIYDVFIDAEGRLVLSLADVSGHGVPAAFLTAVLQDAFRQSTLYHDDLREIVQRVNASLARYSASGCFATMVICRWSASGDRVEIVNAGHHAPLWVTASGNVEAFPDRVGLLLGFSEEWPGEVVTRDTSGDVALLVTSDGVTEARDPAGNEYGLQRLAERLSGLHAGTAASILAALSDEVHCHCGPHDPKDDVTLLVVKRNG
ncbi:MAG: SpoIIE family protein phosphatase [Phycisphaerae bacterium]|nr:SpoIIE family protein phosphatase [Phycisphaerae bacterium]